MSNEYKNARAERKAAKVRAKAMRPWYAKKRTWLAGIIAVIVIIVIATNVGGSSGGSSASNSPATTSTSSPSAPTSSSSGSNPGGADNPACGHDLKVMEQYIAKGDYSDAGSDANNDSTDATRQHEFLGAGIASDYSQLGLDADSAGMDKATGGSSYSHDVSEVKQDLQKLQSDCKG